MPIILGGPPKDEAVPASSSTGLSVAGLRELIRKDELASNALQVRIDKLRQDILDGKELSGKKIDLMQSSNKDMTKDLVKRIEAVEADEPLYASDREVLQALNARLTVCDKQAMRLAELRDLELEFYDKKQAQSLPKHQKQAAKPEPEPEEAIPAHGNPSSANKEGVSSDHVAAREPVETTAASPPVEPHVTERTASTADAEKAESSEEIPQAIVQHVPDEPGYEFVEGSESSTEHGVDTPEDSDEDEDEEDSEPDMSKWPALYRLLEIDPATPPYLFQQALTNAKAKAAINHDPARHPNDQDAAGRWSYIMTAYNTLSDPDKKKFYDMHQKTPAELEGVDLEKLSLGGAK